jgi:hypothetical protein
MTRICNHGTRVQEKRYQPNAVGNSFAIQSARSARHDHPPSCELGDFLIGKLRWQFDAYPQLQGSQLFDSFSNTYTLHTKNRGAYVRC